MPEELPQHVVDFLRECVTSFEVLEAILALRAAPRAWSATALAERIHVPIERAADALEWLRKCRLTEPVQTTERETHYRLAPKTPEGARAVDDLVRAFEEQRATVLRVMHDRLRPGRSPVVLREDFAGTAADSVAWVALGRGCRAVAVDLDAGALAWASARAARLLGERAGAVEFVESDVMAAAPPRVPAKRRLIELVSWAAALGVLAWAWQGADIRPYDLIAYSGNMATFARDFLEPDFHRWPLYAEQMLVSVQIAIWGTVLAVVAGIPLGILCADNVAPAWITFPIRRVMDTARAINEMVFAVLFVILNIMLTAMIVQPITQLSEAADLISKGRMEGAEFPDKGKDEVSQLGQAFNRMRRSLEKAISLIDKG